MPARKILIAAGGTGGHIYPALAIADAFLQKKPDTQIEFVGTKGGLENKVIPAKGFKVNHLSIGRLNANVALSERIKTLLLMPLAFVQSWRLLRRYRPDLVLGVGGHASGPLLLMAALFGYHSSIWEPNAMPGLANRWLAKFVDDCWVVFDEAKPLLKNANLFAAGMPVRREIEEANKHKPAHGSVFMVLVFGGSQGARGINNALVDLLKEGGDWLKGMHFVHQTGVADGARVRAAYGPLIHSGLVDVHDYLYDMDRQYAQADLVIARSGTGTLSELAACGMASILVPLPTASDDHQRKNAESLANKGAALVILQADLSTQNLRAAITSLRNDPARRHDMEERIRGFHRPAAADSLVGDILQRIESHASS